MKYWLKSKTLNAAFISTVLVAIEMNLHLVKSALGESAYNGILFAVLILNAIFGYLRTVTTQPVARKKTMEKHVS